MSSQLSNSLIQPFRSASKPYQYLAVAAVVGSVAEAMLDWLYKSSNEAFRPSDYVNMGLMVAFLVAVLILRGWAKNVSPEVTKHNQKLTMFVFLCIIGLPVMIKIFTQIWYSLAAAL